MGKGGRPFKVHKDLEDLWYTIREGDQIRTLHIVKKHGIEAFNGEKQTALVLASLHGQIEILKWLIENGANVNQQDRHGTTGLHLCGESHRIQVANILLENGANPNLKDEHDNSPLWTALFNAKGNFDLVKILVQYGADPSPKNIYGRSPDDMARTIYKKGILDLIK